MKKYVRKLGLSALGACSCLGFASSAFAALDTEFEIFVIDGSGTMTDPAKVSSGDTISKWNEAFTLMYAKLEAQAAGTELDWFGNAMPKRKHCIAVWVFAGSTYRQVYPLTPSSTGQPWTPDPAAMNNSYFTCAADDTDRTHYTAVADYLKNHVQFEPTIAPQDMGPRTPLADATCAALQGTRTVQTGNSTAWRRVVLYSDGIENESSGECSGDTGYLFDPKAKDSSGTYYLWAGGTPATSWQYKMFSKAVVNNPDPYASGMVATATTGKTIGGVTYFDLDTRAANPEESFSQFLTRAIKGGTAAVMQKRVSLDVYALYDFIQGQSNISTDLQAFYDTLSKNTGGASIRVEYDINGVVGVVDPKSGLKDRQNHDYKNCKNRLDGDTDCSGSVGEADFNQVLQIDVWNQPVVLGHDGVAPIVHELRNKADHNRDGYIDDKDLDMVLMNWF